MGRDFGHEVVKALGLDSQRVRSLTLNIAPNHAVLLTVERYVLDDETKEMLLLLEKYRLVKIDEVPDTGANI